MSQLIEEHNSNIIITNYKGIDDLKCTGCEDDQANQLGHTDEYSSYGCLTLSEHIYCKININIKTMKYTHENNKEYYYISYTYEYGDYDESKNCNPFIFPVKVGIIDHIDGDIIVKNEISKILVNMLIINNDIDTLRQEVTILLHEINKFFSLDRDSLSKLSGRVDPDYYKQLIIKIYHNS